MSPVDVGKVAEALAFLQKTESTEGSLYEHLTSVISRVRHTVLDVVVFIHVCVPCFSVATLSRL